MSAERGRDRNRRKRQHHTAKQRQTGAAEWLVGASKHKRQDWQNARTQYG
jgi:hypothetical protein